MSPSRPTGPVVATAPGRVNLIGDHVDYMGGLVLPMAVDLGTTVRLQSGGARLRLTSDAASGAVDLPLPVADVGRVEPPWGRFVAAVAAELGARVGGTGSVSTTLPIEAGLSSSAALEVAVALALGHESGPLDLALLCQRAEQRATGVPTGIMDQMAITSGRAGCALLIDCRDLTVQPVTLPEGVVVHAVHSGIPRRLVGSEYAARRAACERAEALVGPLREATAADLDQVGDLIDRRRARHVITEIVRVRAAVDAAVSGDAAAMGTLMNESHDSLRDDFDVSVPALDELVARLQATPGVYGARLSGAGFGGCAVALAAADTDPARIGGWRLHASAGARIL